MAGLEDRIINIRIIKHKYFASITKSYVLCLKVEKKKFLGFWGVIVKLLMFWKIFIGVLEKSCKDWFLFYCPTKILMILLYVFPEKQKYFQL
jgi:hypothetical protein